MKIAPLTWLCSLSLCAVPLVGAGCATAGAAGDAPSAETKAGGDEKGAKDADDAEEQAEELAKKKFDLECLRLDLEIKKLSLASDERSSERAIADAERELRDAREKLQAFTSHERPHKLDDGRLDLDQTEQRRKEEQAELDELKAMYDQEDLASLTKELVMDRGRKSLEFAQRRLDLQARSYDHLKTVEVPREQRELEEAVQKAERDLAEARDKAAKGKLEARLELMKAEREIADAEKAIAKLEKKLQAKA